MYYIVTKINVFFFFFFLSQFINLSKCSVDLIFILKENVHHFKRSYFSRNNYTFVRLIFKENKPIQITIPNKHAKKIRRVYFQVLHI